MCVVVVIQLHMMYNNKKWRLKEITPHQKLIKSFLMVIKVQILTNRVIYHLCCFLYWIFILVHLSLIRYSITNNYQIYLEHLIAYYDLFENCVFDILFSKCRSWSIGWYLLSPCIIKQYNCKLCSDNIITYAVETVEGDEKGT